ncbi:MAG: NAD(P)H-binding protein [Anaerolineae bacterium]|nr:NAD(P)H-binding protein [Anaerolineae bacterium]NUQ05021.1 NAD(P)H-binding protein [Anaerolineae bacterium]
MILVTGATGFIGRHLVTRLLMEGRRVRCLLDERHAAHLPWQMPPEIVTGSLFDEETAFKAVSGAHVVIHLESAQWWGRPRDLERVELNGARALITAARSARVGRIITVSHLGASPSAAYALLRYKGLVEEAVRTSGLAYTILRSGILFGEDDAFINHIAMQIHATPLVYLVPGQGEVVLHPLYVEDMVSALVGSLSAIDTVDAVIEIGGPEYITFADLIRTVMRVSGTSRMTLSVPPYLLRWAAGFYGRVLPRALVTPQWFDLIATSKTAHLGNIYRYFGFQPRRLEDTLLTYMRGRRYGAMALRETLRRRPVRP